MKGLLRLPDRGWRLLKFIAWYFGQLVLANLSVARHVLSPRYQAVPGITRVPVRSTRDSRLALLAGLVSLTPGTLVLEVGGTPAVMFVHGLHAPDSETLRLQVQEVEERMLAALDSET